MVLTPPFSVYLEGLCTILYDTMRPFIIHINHLETLAEICSILRIEMLEEHVQQNRMSLLIFMCFPRHLTYCLLLLATGLEAFATIAHQLLQDVQERLVFRAHLYLQSDIQNYNPSTGDLAYPEKLEMMEVRLLKSESAKNLMQSCEILKVYPLLFNSTFPLQSIALSLQEPSQLRRSDSRASMMSTEAESVDTAYRVKQMSKLNRATTKPLINHVF